jgi:hypothetical protein
MAQLFTDLARDLKLEKKCGKYGVSCICNGSNTLYLLHKINHAGPLEGMIPRFHFFLRLKKVKISKG